MGGYGWNMQLTGASLQDAFADARAADRAEYGHSAYTGSIAQADGVSEATKQVCHPAEAALLAGQLLDGLDCYDGHDPDARSADPAARQRAKQRQEAREDAAARRLAGRLGITYGRSTSSWGSSWASDPLPIAQKWDGAYAIPTAAPEQFTVRRRGVPVDLLKLDLSKPMPHDSRLVAHLHDRLAEELGHPPRIAAIEVLDDSPRYVTTVKATEGPVATVYHVYQRSGHGLTRASQQAHDSMAKARAELTALVKAGGPSWGDGSCEYVVLGERRRADGQPLVVGKRELASRTVIFTVSLVSPKKAALAPTGWHVYGVAGS